MSILKVNDIQEATSGSGKAFVCRAWVLFNGEGTIAILGDQGVSSLTDHTTGQHSANLSNTMTNANGAAVAAHTDADNVTLFNIIGARQTTTTAMRVGTYEGGFTDRKYISVALLND
jgi:hypothetical protein